MGSETTRPTDRLERLRAYLMSRMRRPRSRMTPTIADLWWRVYQELARRQIP